MAKKEIKNKAEMGKRAEKAAPKKEAVRREGEKKLSRKERIQQ